MQHDLIIRGGSIVDGSGRERYVGDVAVGRGRITQVGKVEGDAAETIDASGRIVCPGFVDPHTHYDAQLSWDSQLVSSSEHGVTTVVMGNCGIGIAPCRPADRAALIQDLVNVEGMSQDVLEAGVQWQWESFPEYLQFAASRACTINRAFLVPLAPLRNYAIGPEASERAATAEETERIAGLLRDAMLAGASGFSSTNNRSHIGFKGKPLAARLTSRAEYGAYCKVLRDLGRGTIQIALVNEFGRISDAEYELLDFLLTESGRPVTFGSLLNNPANPNGCRDLLDKADPLLKRRSAPQMLIRSMWREFSLHQPYPMSDIEVIGRRVFNRPREEQRKAFADPAFRAEFRAELDKGRRFSGHPPRVVVCKVDNPALRPYETRTVAEIAAMRKADPVDAMFDIAVEDDLKTMFAYERANDDRQQIADMLRDPRSLIGLSDGGAHVDMLYEAGYTTYLLSHWVRDKKVLSLERAIHRITTEPADYFGLSDRGRLAPGAAADIVIFDEAKIGSDERGTFVYDLPTGAGRLHAKSRGIDRVLVNGVTTWRDGQPTGDLPGKVVGALPDAR